MRAAIFNPYLDTLGGGERYAMSVAQVLVDAGYSVDVEWQDEGILKSLADRFALDLAQVKVVDSIQRGDGYDVCFWVSDGSIPTLRSRKNLLHFQFPFQNVNGNTLMNKMKFIRINKVICNSNFTKGFIDAEYGIKSVVVYPPVDVTKFKPTTKKNLIIYIGRFSQLTQSKGQDVLIEAFKKFYDMNNRSWKMVLAGGTEVGVDNYIQELRKSAEGYPIRIIESPKFKDLTELFGQAKVFWSASGFGVDEQKDPIKVEHFGITLVEAMSTGAVAFAYEAGGHSEIITDGSDGFLWKTIDELVVKTTKAIGNKELFSKVSFTAQASAQKFSFERFKDEVINLL